jgi:hypothetical protein
MTEQQNPDDFNAKMLKTIEQQFGKETKPWSTGRKIGVWGTLTALVLAVAGYFIYNRISEKNAISDKKDQIAQVIPGMPSRDATALAEIMIKNPNISDLVIKEIKTALDTTGYREKYDLTEASVLKTAIANKGQIAYGFAPDGKPWSFSHDTTASSQRNGAAMNLVHMLSDAARAGIKGEPPPKYVPPAPDTSKNFQKSDKKFPKRTDPKHSKPQNQKVPKAPLGAMMLR